MTLPLLPPAPHSTRTFKTRRRITSYEYDIYRVGGNVNIYSECYIGFQLDADDKLDYMLTINGGWKLHFILGISSVCVRLFSLFNLRGTY